MKGNVLKFIGQLFLMSLMLVTVGCAPKSGKTTKANILVMGGIGVATGPGSIQYAVLYGSGPGHKFAMPIPTSGEIVIPDLKNGSWNFYIVGYSAPNLTGVMKCGIAVADLKGGNFNLSLGLTNAACNTTPFVSVNGIGYDWETTLSPGALEPPKVVLNNCKSLSKITAAKTDSPNVATACAEENIGPYTSFRIGLGFFDSKLNPEGGHDNNFLSNCFVVEPTTLATGMDSSITAGNAPKLPTGLNGIAPFYTTIHAYYGSSDCGATNSDHGFKIFRFTDGVHGLNRTHIYDNSGYYTAINLDASDAEICSGDRLLTTHHHPFAAGNGAGVPYRICNEAQFNSVGGNTNWPTYFSRSFALAAHLNFKDLTAQDPNILESYKSFTPWGNDIQDLNTAFTGKFFGNNYSISYPFLFLEGTGKDSYGLIRSANGAHIYDLVIKNAAIESKDSSYIGGVVGRGTGLTLKNIKFHGFVAGIGRVGGIVGDLLNTSNDLSYVHANLHMDINDGSYAGGLVGEMATGSITKSSAKVEINGKGNTNLNYIGGLVGNALGTLNISESVTMGKINGRQYLGGLVGYFTVLSTVSNSYSLAHINSMYHSNSGSEYHYVGGLWGWNSASITAEYSFHAFGSLKGSVGPSGNTQKIGGISGSHGTSPTCTFLLAENNNLTCSLYTFGGATILDAALFASSWVTASPAKISTDAVSEATTIPWYRLNIDGGDYPRLAFELKKNPRTGKIVEDEVPYLKRHCNSIAHFAASPVLDSAGNKMICKPSHFINLQTDIPNKLYRDLSFKSYTTFVNSIKSSGVYRLNGNGYGFHNITLNPDASTDPAGIFSGLEDTSNISNLELYNVGMKMTTGHSLNNSEEPKIMGLLAGINNGSINQVKLENGQIKLMNITAGDNTDDDVDNETNDGIVLGSLVGRNSAAGIISDSEIYSSMDLDDLATNPNDGVFHAAGGVGFNAGTMQKLRVGSDMRYNSSGTTTDTTSRFGLAAVAITNNGTISEVGVEHGGIYIENSAADTTGTTGGFLSGFVVDNFDNINNSFSKVSFQLTGYDYINSPKDFSGTAAAFATYNEGVLNRVYYFKDMSGDQNRIDEMATGTTTALFSLDDNGGTQTGTFCVDYHAKFCGGANVATANLEGAGPYDFSLQAGGLQISDGTTTETLSTWNTPDVVEDMFFNFRVGTWLIEPGSDESPKLINIDGGPERIQPGF